MFKQTKSWLAHFLAVAGRYLAHGPLRRLVLWLWKKTVGIFLDE